MPDHSARFNMRLPDAYQNSYLQPFAVDAGCVLYEPKQPAGCLYLLGSGDVRLLMCPSEQKDDVKGTNSTEMDEKPDPRTRRYKRLAALNPGAIFGVDALVGQPAARQTRAISHTASSGWTLEVHFMPSAEITHPEVVRALYKLMAVEVTQRLSAAAHELLLVDA